LTFERSIGGGLVAGAAEASIATVENIKPVRSKRVPIIFMLGAVLSRGAYGGC
jgi:hypothetical protein